MFLAKRVPPRNLVRLRARNRSPFPWLWWWSSTNRLCGTGRTRTGNLLNAIETLSSLSYGPILIMLFRKIARVDRSVFRAGGATGNRTPIPAVRVQRSPVELSPQTICNVRGRSGKRRNRTLSTGFWRPVGRHDSATQVCLVTCCTIGASYGNRTRLGP
jgi:hypothetical protein